MMMMSMKRMIQKNKRMRMSAGPLCSKRCQVLTNKVAVPVLAASWNLLLQSGVPLLLVVSQKTHPRSPHADETTTPNPGILLANELVVCFS